MIRRSLKSLLNLVSQNERIAPGETIFYIEDGIEIDFCVSQTFDTNVRLIGDTSPAMDAGNVGICSAETSNFFVVGFVPDLPCQVAVDLTCFIENGNERINCKDIPMVEDEEDCIKEVVYATIVTNVGDERKTILSLDRTRDGETADLIGLLNKRDLDPGDFAVAREEGEVLDFCVQRLVTTSTYITLLYEYSIFPFPKKKSLILFFLLIAVEVESEAFGVGQLECFEQATLVFSVAVTCDVSVSVDCFADASRDFSVPCSDFNPFASQSLMVGCEHVHKYVYTIENTGPGDQVVEGVVVTRDGVSTNQLERRFNLDPDEVREVTEFQLVDYCQEYPNGITTEVEVSADMIPVGGSCFDNDQITVFPATEECNVALNPFIRCTVEAPDGKEVLCSVYHEQINDLEDKTQCEREVTFEYTLVNEGLACILIYRVTAEIDNEGSFDLTPAMGKTLCPEESLTIEQKQIEDFCDEDLQDRVVVIVNDGPPETCGGRGALGFFPPEIEFECIIDLDLTCTTSTGADCVVSSQQRARCELDPDYIEFSFTAKPCDFSDNSQDGTFVCRDGGNNIDTLVSAFVFIESLDDDKYFADTVQIGDVVRLEHKDLKDEVLVKIFDEEGGVLVQNFKMSVSCLNGNGLFTNDKFGALTVTGFGDKKNQLSSPVTEDPDSVFEFAYTVLNVGETDAFLKEITFLSGGSEITSIDLGSSALQVGRSFSDSETINLSSLSSATDVSAVVKANSPADLECSAEDRVTIGFESLDPPVVTSTEEGAKVICLACPKIFLFKFRGGKCDKSRNSQNIKCSDKLPIGSSAQVIVSDSYQKTIFFDQHLKKNSVFEVHAGSGSFKEGLIVKIIVENEIAQIMQFHSGCVEPIYLGDVFGSIEVVGWKNFKQGYVKLS